MKCESSHAGITIPDLCIFIDFEELAWSADHKLVWYDQKRTQKLNTSTK